MRQCNLIASFLWLQKHLTAHVHSECAFHNSQHSDFLDDVSNIPLPALCIAAGDKKNVTTATTTSIKLALRTLNSCIIPCNPLWAYIELVIGELYDLTQVLKGEVTIRIKGKDTNAWLVLTPDTLKCFKSAQVIFLMITPMGYMHQTSFHISSYINSIFSNYCTTTIVIFLLISICRKKTIISSCISTGGIEHARKTARRRNWCWSTPKTGRQLELLDYGV